MTTGRAAILAAGAGFGLSVGADVYEGLKRHWLLVAIMIATCGTAFGTYLLSRGNRGGFWRVTLLVIVPAGVAIGTSLRTTAAVAEAVGMDRGRWLLLQMGMVLIGTVAGLACLPFRMARSKREAHNAAFLQAEGIRSVGGRRRVIVTARGDEYELDDVRDDAITFRGVDDEGSRAWLEVDHAGRFTKFRERKVMLSRA